MAGSVTVTTTGESSVVRVDGPVAAAVSVTVTMTVPSPSVCDETLVIWDPDPLTVRVNVTDTVVG
jgi:hypothetical protein